MRALSVGNMYPPHHLGGYELTWRSAVGHLRDAGHEVRVLTTNFRRPGVDTQGDEDADVHRELRWYWHDHAFPRIGLAGRLALERHNAAALDRHLREFSPDVMSWWAMGGMSLALIERARRAGLPASGVVGDEWMEYGPRVDGWLRLWKSRSALGKLVERASGIPTSVDLGAAGSWLFNSELTRARSLQAGWMLPHQAVEHPGVDHSLFYPAPVRPWAGRLLYVGRIDARKGIDTAINALGLLHESTTLTVLGSGDETHLEELRTLARKGGLESRVVFSHVPRTELPSCYDRADVLLFPVRWEEPWGLVPLEAMATGTPVVATGTGGSREYLRHGENCLIFAPRDDEEELAEAIRTLASNEALRSRIRGNGLATAARFTEGGYNRTIENDLAEAAARQTRAGAPTR